MVSLSRYSMIISNYNFVADMFTNIYKTVNILGTDSFFAPMRELVIPKGKLFMIECRPTTPDIEVTLNVVCMHNITENEELVTNKRSIIRRI